MRVTVVGLLAAMALSLSDPAPIGAEPAQPSPPPQPSPAASVPDVSALTDLELNNRGVELAKGGRFDEAIALLRSAHARAPKDDLIRTNLAGILTDSAAQLESRGRLADAVKALEEATQLDVTLWPAAGRLAELYYGLDPTLDRAIAMWTQAYQHVPPDQRPGLASRIVQAQRDATIERTFTTLSTGHFQIRYDGEQHAAPAATLGTVLEAAHTRLRELVGDAPPKVTVLLYSGGDFQRIAGRRDWALGLYDGRIRLRIDELQQHDVVPIAVAHELGHAYLADTYGPALPTWVHEGFAQMVEPPVPPTPQQQALLHAIRSRTAWVPLKWLDRRFTRPSHAEDVDRAYAQSRYAVDQLITRFGMDRWLRFLRTIQGGTPVDEAASSVFGVSWSRIDQGNFE
jgi:hypothetical protein